MFTKLDTNGDGSVSLDEMSKALQGAAATMAAIIMRRRRERLGRCGPAAPAIDAPSSSQQRGSSSTTTTNGDGSTTTTVTYADGFKVTTTAPARIQRRSDVSTGDFVLQSGSSR